MDDEQENINLNELCTKCGEYNLNCVCYWSIHKFFKKFLRAKKPSASLPYSKVQEMFDTWMEENYPGRLRGVIK
jgi:hypothetical protein